MGTPTETSIHVGPETETGRGWSYEVALKWSECLTTLHTVTLSWADHDLIAGGMYPPSRTVEAAMGVVLGVGDGVIETSDLPDRFDVSTLRRMIDGFDERVRGGL